MKPKLPKSLREQVKNLKFSTEESEILLAPESERRLWYWNVTMMTRTPEHMEYAKNSVISRHVVRLPRGTACTSREKLYESTATCMGYLPGIRLVYGNYHSDFRVYLGVLRRAGNAPHGDPVPVLVVCVLNSFSFADIKNINGVGLPKSMDIDNMEELNGTFNVPYEMRDDVAKYNLRFPHKIENKPMHYFYYRGLG